MTEERRGVSDEPDEPDNPTHPLYRQPPTGYAVRRPAGDDLHRVAMLYDRSAVRSRHGTTGRGALRAEADLGRTWAARRSDALVVESALDGSIVGYLEFHEDHDPWTSALDLYAEGRIDPRTDARLVGEFLLLRALDRASLAVDRSDEDRPTTLRTTVVDPSPATLRWFAERGLTPERHMLRLRIDLADGTPDPVWPEGVRPVSASTLPEEAVHAALVASFADHHLGASDELEDWRAVRLRTGRVDLAVSLAAVDVAPDDHAAPGTVPAVAGVALGRLAGARDPGLGVITDLGVRPDRRGDGLATALLRAAFRRFAELGAVRVGLEVDDVTLDGALRLYERAGMEVIHHVIVLTTGPLAD